MKLINANDQLPLTMQLDLLEIARSTYYYKSRLKSEREVQVKNRIDEIHTKLPFYGSRRIHQQLKQEEWVIGANTVAKYMQEMGIGAIYPAPNLSKRTKKSYIYPYLLRNVTASYPNHVWGIDITYIRLKKGWVYLVAILDWFSRYIVSWELSDSLEIEFVLDCVDKAFSQARPTIFNSDQGAHFSSPKYIERLQNRNVQISMDGKGRAIDNIFTERLWRSVKYEEVYVKEYASPKDARKGLADYITFYNTQRFHQSLDYAVPSDLYFGTPKYRKEL